MLTKISDWLKELQFTRYPIGTYCFLSVIALRFSEPKIHLLLSQYVRNETISQIETAVDVINEVLQYVCITLFVFTCLAGIISHITKKLNYGCLNELSMTMEGIRTEFDELLCGVIPIFLTSCLLLFIFNRSYGSEFDIVVTLLAGTLHLIAWLSEISRKVKM